MCLNHHSAPPEAGCQELFQSSGRSTCSVLDWGLLGRNSINRTLAKALIKLAPADLEFTEIPIKDLPLYSYDYDADFPPAGRALKARASPQASSAPRRAVSARR